MPDVGPVFLAAPAVHVTAGVTSVVAEALAALARKRAGRHPRAGVVYLYGIGVVFVTATVMAGLRWREDWHLFGIASLAHGLAVAGRWACRRRPRRRMLWHGWMMAAFYIALLTRFHVEQRSAAADLDRLPHLTYWLLPPVSADLAGADPQPRRSATGKQPVTGSVIRRGASRRCTVALR